MVQAFFGTNSFAIKRDIGRIRADHPDAEVEIIDAQEVEDVSEIIQRVAGQSLFSSNRVVILKNISKHTKLRERLEEIVALNSDQAVVVIQESLLDKRTSYYKQLKKHTQLTEHTDLSEDGAVEFVKNYMSELGSIDQRTAVLLVSRVGIDQQLLMNELDKLLLHNKSVTEESVLQLTESNPKDTAFMLTDALAEGDSKKAVQIYQNLRGANEEAQKILGALNWQYFTLLKIHANLALGTPQAIASSAGLHPFVVQKNMRVAKKLNKNQLKNCIETLVRTERRIKTTQTDIDQAMETGLLQLGAAVRN